MRGSGIKQTAVRPCHRSAAYPDCDDHPCDKDHQLEKLQFALAVAFSRGSQERIQALQARIAELGGEGEEPGT